ncbi:Nickel transport system permease protein nikB [Fusobacterium necrogenes]|uniref:Nickel transport system permease protein nikB n=1 Tax=Fusobacterium necrogenes TaxID=858 RepID=A0A377GZG8_9FUSO|nr:ABC transporter permease [Fusobacterium necrogenes]STO32325.1 Nickel transport system permease protein nikB [Fusobacterium necrogenes]
MYYLKKILKMVFSIYLIGSISFLLLEMIPGDPALAILGLESSAEDIAMLRNILGLNKRLQKRYLEWGKGVLTGNFGNSFKYGEPVSNLIMERLPLTLKVAILTIIMVLIVSIPLSFMIYRIKNKKVRKIIDFIIGLCISMPSFWLGIISMFLFSVILKWFSVGYDNTIISLLLPCFVIAIPNIGIFISYIKNNLEVELREEYTKYLFVNGVKSFWLNFYILKNSVIPIIPLIGLMLIDLITGVVIIEQIFSIPGIGRLMITAVVNRDLPLVQGLIFYTSVVMVMLNFLIDLIYSIVDPRIRSER